MFLFWRFFCDFLLNEHFSRAEKQDDARLSYALNPKPQGSNHLVDLRYNPMSVEEDYYIPIRGNNSNTRIENLAGGQHTTAIDDVKYLRDKLFSALKIPQAYLAMGEGAAEDKTTLAQKDIRFARTIQRLQRVIIAELTKIGIIHLYTLGFRGDERSFFEMWQKAAFDQGTNNVHFYDEYTGGLRIYQLGSFAGNDDKDRIAYGVELFEVFPKTISAVSYSNEAENQIQKISVSLAFRNWINITMDRQGSYTTGGPYQKPVVIGANKGLIGGLLDKLPPELQRAGRQVTNIIRQRVPIGEVTGGRVFPPLF